MDIQPFCLVPNSCGKKVRGEELVAGEANPIWRISKDTPSKK